MIFGYDSKKLLVKGLWLDSWHTDINYNIFQGFSKDSTIILNGSYQAPEGPDWGWRIELDFSEIDIIHVLMFNKTPDGQEAKAVEVKYRKN